MNFSRREETRVKTPAPPPIDLDSGRLDVARAALAGGFSLGALVIAAAGGWLVVWSWSTGAWFGLVVGLVVNLVGLVFGGVVLWVSVSEWIDHRERVADWHAVALETYSAADGAQTMERVSEWELSADDPAHVLIAALWTHMRVRAGEENPYTVRKLLGPVFLADRRVGDLSKGAAESMGKRFAALGLIAGRSERSAGEWMPESADDIVQLVLSRWRN